MMDMLRMQVNVTNPTHRWGICFFFLFVLFGQARASQDSVLSATDSVHLANSQKKDSILQRYNMLNTGAVQNIHVYLLDKELANMRMENTHLQSTLDSLKSTEELDSLSLLATRHRALLDRLRGFRNTIDVYQGSLTEVTTALNSLENDSLSKKLQPVIRQTSLESQQKLDSLRLLSKQSDTLWARTNQLSVALNQAMQQHTNLNKRNNAQFIWAAPKDLSPKRVLGSLKNTYAEKEAIKHYVYRTEWSGRIFLVLLSIGFFYWIYSTGKALSLHQPPANQKPKPYTPFHDILKGLAFLFTLLPLFSSIIPSLLVQLTQPLVYLLFAILFRNRLTKKQQRFGGSLLVFYLLVILANSIVNEGLIFRLISLSLNILALFFASRLERWIKVAFIFSNLLALTLNVLGLVEYSRYWSIAGAVGLLQLYSLKAFSWMIRQAFVQQFDKSRLTKGFFNRFNRKRTLKTLHRLLTFLCLCLTVMVLAINLHILQTLQASFGRFLQANHHLGSITFTYGNLIVCALVISLANWLQKNVVLFFTDSPTASYEKSIEEPLTLMPLFRLIIVVLGFFFGVSALGIGLDKLTVIIGALSVGIGLGLQNIFNNFVSGVILVFEKPFRIGDYVELADKKGKVQQIGIRSSTLLTPEGAEVIIPNGDLLSGRLVNWTLNKTYSKTSVNLKVDRQADMEKIKKMILEEVSRIEYTMKDMDVVIRYQDISTDMLSIWIDCWIVHIYNESIFRSQLLENLNKRASAEGIQIVSV